jgi:membrane-bound lytic murein transglycosylase A
MSNRSGILLSIVIAGMALTGCQKPEPIPLTDIRKDYDRQLAPGQWALRKVDPSQYPAFGDAWYSAKGNALREATGRSITYLNKPSSKKYFPSGEITHEQALASLHVFLRVLDEARTPADLDAAIREQFDVYTSVGCDDAGTVLFTGYYSPIFDGSLTQTDQFRYPLYKLPPDFAKDPEGNPLQGLWNTREEIERDKLLEGNELAWVGDPFEAYVMTVQGSGFIRLPDGNLHEIGYAGHNGHEYTPIGRLLVADGKIPRDQLSLDTLIRYFKEHPDELEQYLYQNKRYVFFQEATGGPYGCLAEQVTPLFSVATDKEIFPRGCLAFVDTRIPKDPGRSMRTYRSFVLDQDRGAAIRAPGRCDIYMGVGDAAGKMAGFTYNEGRLYYLIAKNGVAPTPPLAGADQPESPVPPQG